MPLVNTEMVFSGLPVNFHITRTCDYWCGHCFGTFLDVAARSASGSEEQQLRVVTTLSHRGASKITFSGGEPLGVRWLTALVRRAHSLGVTTCVVTNGSRLSEEWLADMAADLDWLTLSVDSAIPETNLLIGRARAQELSGRNEYLVRPLEHLAEVAQSLGIGVKVNTVVTKYNAAESLSEFITAVMPARWKIMQAVPVQGQEQRADEEWLVSAAEFESFVDRHRAGIPTEVTIVPEPIGLIRGSYVMVDPWGRIFESSSGSHRYCGPVEQATSDTIDRVLNRQKLLERAGLWDWAGPSSDG